jgi:hypothetical protein
MAMVNTQGLNLFALAYEGFGLAANGTQVTLFFFDLGVVLNGYVVLGSEHPLQVLGIEAGAVLLSPHFPQCAVTLGRLKLT